MVTLTSIKIVFHINGLGFAVQSNSTSSIHTIFFQVFHQGNRCKKVIKVHFFNNSITIVCTTCFPKPNLFPSLSSGVEVSMASVTFPWYSSADITIHISSHKHLVPVLYRLHGVILFDQVRPLNKIMLSSTLWETLYSLT